MLKIENKYFVLEGNVGAGKSTFLKILDKYLNLEVICEPIAKWQDVGGENLLEYFYKDTPRWAYTFQTYAFVTRVLELEKNLKSMVSPALVLERSVYSDRYCFAKTSFELGLMTSLEWKLYTEWFEWLVQTYTQKPSGFIYLQTDPQVCYERILKRNRSEELGVSFDYFKLLHEKHESWLIKKENIADYLRDIPVLVIPVNDEFEQDEAVQKKYIEKIVDFLELNFEICPEMSLKQSLLL